MIIFIDGVEYRVDGAKAAEHIKSFYSKESERNQVFDLGNGKKLDFGKKSLIRIGMKTAMVPFVVPVIGLLYRMRGLDPPKHAKHEDLIDWMVRSVIDFGGIIEQDVVLHAVSEDLEADNSGVRSIKSVSTDGTDIFNYRRFQQHRLPAGPVWGEVPVNEVSGGETHVHSGSNGHGEDNVRQGGDRQET